ASKVRWLPCRGRPPHAASPTLSRKTELLCHTAPPARRRNPSRAPPSLARPCPLVLPKCATVAHTFRPPRPFDLRRARRRPRGQASWLLQRVPSFRARAQRLACSVRSTSVCRVASRTNQTSRAYLLPPSCPPVLARAPVLAQTPERLSPAHGRSN